MSTKRSGRGRTEVRRIRGTRAKLPRRSQRPSAPVPRVAAEPRRRAVLLHRGDEAHLLREIVRTYQALLAGFARTFGVPAARFLLVRELAVATTDLGILDLARRLGVNAAAVTRQVQDLEAEGFVRRRHDPRDRRRCDIRLTARGRRLVTAIHRRTHQFERAVARQLQATDVTAAIRVLTTLRQQLDDLPRSGGVR